MANRYRSTTNEDRGRIVQAYEDGEDFLSLAYTLGIRRSTAYLFHRYMLCERREEVEVVRLTTKQFMIVGMYI